MTENRLLGADFMRAVACLTVLFHHLAQRMNFDRDYGPVLNVFRTFSHTGTFGVAIFFVLSGYLLARPFWQALDRNAPMPSLALYASRRAARILPGYWLALIVTFGLSILLFGATLDGELILRFAAGALLVADWHWLTFFPVEVNGPLWSISFEVTSYALLPLGLLAVFALAPLAKGWASRLVWIGVIGLALIGHWLYLTQFPMDEVRRGWDHGLVGGAKYWMPRYNPFALFAMFALGALASGVQVRLAGLRSWLFDLLAIGAMALSVWAVMRHLGMRVDASGFGWLEIPYGFPWFQLGIAGFLAVSPSSVLLGRLLDNPVSRYIATISFGIYIWHYLVMELIRLYWEPGFVYGNIADMSVFLTLCAAVTAISVLLGHLSWRLVEKPAIDWARRRESSPSSRLAPQAAQ